MTISSFLSQCLWGRQHAPSLLQNIAANRNKTATLKRLPTRCSLETALGGATVRLLTKLSVR